MDALSPAQHCTVKGLTSPLSISPYAVLNIGPSVTPFRGPFWELDIEDLPEYPCLDSRF
jgi:ubiquitin-protein ligase